MFRNTTTRFRESTKCHISSIRPESILNRFAQPLIRFLEVWHDLCVARETLEESGLEDDHPNATIRKTTERTGGTEQAKGAYAFVFSGITLSIEFTIDEITVNGEYAFARMTSKGSTLIHASGETELEENRELFMLQKENGS